MQVDVRDPGSVLGLGRSSKGGMTAHSSILAWRIPWTEEPGRLQSKGSHRVGHNSIFKSRDITLPTKVHLVKAMVFPAVMYGCESLTVKKAERWKNWCIWTVVLEKTLESPLDCKETQPIHSEDQPWDFFGRNDAKAETPVLWPPHAKSWLIGKGSDAGRDWGQEEKGTTEDEMAGWHHRLDGRESEWTPGVGDGQGGLACLARLSDWPN